MRYFYHPKQKRCKVFMYSGCRGNGNNYRTMSECMQMCAQGNISEVLLQNWPPIIISDDRNETTAIPKLTTTGSSQGENNSTINLEMVSNSTSTPLFNSTSTSLEANSTTGEDQSSNSTVTTVEKTPDECFMSVDSGNCDFSYDYELMYFFDIHFGQCRAFLAKVGCTGNANRFQSKSDCLEHCRLAIHPSTTTQPFVSLAFSII